MVSVRIEGREAVDVSDFEAAWFYLNDVFSSPVDALLFSVEGLAFELGDLGWRACCGSFDHFFLYLGLDSEDAEHGF